MSNDRNQQSPGKQGEKQNMIDTDNDGKFRQKGDTSDHGDPRSPYGKGGQNQKSDDSESETDTE